MGQTSRRLLHAGAEQPDRIGHLRPRVPIRAESVLHCCPRLAWRHAARGGYFNFNAKTFALSPTSRTRKYTGATGNLQADPAAHHQQRLLITLS
jgi:hypothetical protein